MYRELAFKGSREATELLKAMATIKLISDLLGVPPPEIHWSPEARASLLTSFEFGKIPLRPTENDMMVYGIKFIFDRIIFDRK